MAALLRAGDVLDAHHLADPMVQVHVQVVPGSAETEKIMNQFLLDATEAQLDEMIWLVDQLEDRVGIDWGWFVGWVNGDPDSLRIRAGIANGELLIPATVQAIINWFIQYFQNDYP